MNNYVNTFFGYTDNMKQVHKTRTENILNKKYRYDGIVMSRKEYMYKLLQVREHAKKYNIEVVTEIPEGWFKTETMIDPIGSIRISNMKLNLQSMKNKNKKEALLLI